MAAGTGLAIFTGVTSLANSFFGYKTELAEIDALKQKAKNDQAEEARILTLKALDLKEKQLAAQIEFDKSKRLQGTITLLTLVGAAVFLISLFRKTRK